MNNDEDLKLFVIYLYGPRDTAMLDVELCIEKELIFLRQLQLQCASLSAGSN